MHPSHRQVSEWMERNHRLTRHTPVSTLRAVERIDIITFIQDAVNSFSHSLNVKNQSGIALSKSENDHFIIIRTYTALSRLHAEIIAAGHSLGTASALDGGIFVLTSQGKTTYEKMLCQVFDFPADHSFD